MALQSSSFAWADDVHVEIDVMVEMRDGTRLATDIYRPAVNGVPSGTPVPVLLERTPYDKSWNSTNESEQDLGDAKARTRAETAAYFVRRGYAMVYQDCRGRYRSEGTFTKYLSEGEDGYDTVAFLARQPWTTGRIGTMGLSYAAHTQVALACLSPPGLACMVVDSGGFSNAYQGGIRQGGAFELKQATWAWRNAANSPVAKERPLISKALAAEDLRLWFAAMPWKPGHSPVKWVPEYEDYLFEQWRKGSFDDYWKKLGIYAEGYYDGFANVPTILLASWYDAYVRTTIDNYAGLSKRDKGPLRLVMGPWLHGDRTSTFAGDVDFGAAAPLDANIAPNFLEFRRRWFDRWLKDIDNGADKDAPVQLFVMGGGTGRRNADGRLDHGGTWRGLAEWPVPGTVETPYYFHGDGRLSPERPMAAEAKLSYRFDPDNPVPTIGGALTSGEPVFDGGAFDQREGPRFFGSRRSGLPLAARPDILVFESEPLTHDLDVIGEIKIKLWISSDCPDTDFTAKLIDVHPLSTDDPQGFAMNLTDGILRCRYRDSWEEPSFMEPGTVYAITIEPFATCNKFKAGHRIRVDISSSNFPHFDVNPNSGEPEGSGALRRVATNSIWIDAVRASHILLPIVKAG